ncbi:oxidoreductase [Roseibium aquae]|uniref:Oxidoreductase n=1 Tax=Roseibium aquae TaxID=1323746 RepID=A0A916TLM6_9HYPH|nr:Gfo/Idh/MocA family oxidoreductase [Roseibium aquae]GGB53638.1 oxidoreductase [Roseibium aquae]
MVEPTPHRVAILGAGIGEKHLAGFLQLTDRFNVRTICDLDPGKAANLAGQVPGCRVETDLEAVLAAPDIDIVDICLPPHLHGPVAAKAFAAGMHVICEKPIAGSVLEADGIAAAAAAAGRMFFPVFQYRYGRALYQLTALVDSGLAGRPLVATAETHWNRGADYYAVPWRGKWATERGGAILGHAIHNHDLVAQYFGHITSVCAMVDTRVNPIETEDCAALAMTTQSGGLVTSSVTLGSARDETRFRLVFEHLTAESAREPYTPGEGEWRFTARDPERQAEIDRVVARSKGEAAARPEGFAGLFDAIASSLAGMDAGLVDMSSGIRSIELVAAIYLSARTAQTVSLPLDRSHPICATWMPDPAGGDPDDR